MPLSVNRTSPTQAAGTPPTGHRRVPRSAHRCSAAGLAAP